MFIQLINKVWCGLSAQSSHLSQQYIHIKMFSRVAASQYYIDSLCERECLKGIHSVLSEMYIHEKSCIFSGKGIGGITCCLDGVFALQYVFVFHRRP
jgi:hypothetical protein